MSEYSICAAQDSDMDFVRDSFRKSYRDSPRTGKWPQEAFAIWVADHLDKMAASCRIVVARPDDWGDHGIIGWLAAEQQPEQFVLAYAFVRPLFRKQGVMTSLIKSLEPKGKLVFSCLRPPFSAYVQRLGFAFNPRAAS